MSRLIIAVLFAGCIFVSPLVSAAESDVINAILAADKAPLGVVFEMAGGDADSLSAAIKRSDGYRQKLKIRYPRLKFVVLTHGLEQFTLLKENQTEYPQLHQQVASLVNNAKVPVQVCGSFADMMGVDAKDFVPSVSVVDAAPMSLEEYIEKGYLVVEMDLSVK